MSPRNNGGELNGFLDAASEIQGELRFKDTFRLDGKLTGKAVSKGDLIVGKEAVVEGEIEVGGLFVSGIVRGIIRASGKVEISAGARVEADLETPSLAMEEGAFLQGKCSMEKARPVRLESHSVGAVVASES